MPQAHSKTKATAKKSAKRKPTVRMQNGIPLKRKVIWAYDTDSPQFKKRVQAELRDIRRKDAERDGMDFIEAVLADPDVQKWWR
jgi:hypothetical protein